MGHSVIQIKVVGNHGCQREVKDGGTVTAPCGVHGCVDCIAREFTKKLQSSNYVETAKLTHWPPNEPAPVEGPIVDDLVTGERKGSF